VPLGWLLLSSPAEVPTGVVQLGKQVVVVEKEEEEGYGGGRVVTPFYLLDLYTPSTH
jgi:hypothetical protein